MQPEPAAKGPFVTRGLLSGFSASYAHLAATLATTILVSPFYIRWLGIEQYGLWLTVNAWLGYLSLNSSGFPQATQNQAVEDKARGNTGGTRDLLFTSAATTLGLGMMTAGGAGFAIATGVISSRLFQGSARVRQDAIPLLILTGATYLLTLPFEHFRGALRAFDRVATAQTCAALSVIAGGLIGVATLASGGGVLHFAVSQAVVGIIAGVVTFVLAWKVVPPGESGRARFRPKIAKRLLAPSLNFMVIAGAGALIWGTDNLVIAARLGTASVTPFAVTFRMFSLAWSAVSAASVSLLPSITGLWAVGDIPRLQRVTLQAIRAVVAGTLLAGVPLVLWGRPLIRLWVGSAAVASRGTFLVFATIFAVNAFAQAFEMIVIGTSKYRWYTAIVAIEGVLNLGLSLWLVGLIGLPGVAIGTLAAHLLCSGWFLPWYGCRCIQMSIGRVFHDAVVPFLLPMLAAACVSAGVQHALGTSSWLRVAVGASFAIAAGLVAYSLAALNEWERAIVDAIKGARPLRPSPRLRTRGRD